MRIVLTLLAIAALFPMVAGGQVLEYKLQAMDGQVEDWFGSSVAVEDSIVVVGARMDDDNGLASGSVYVFVKDSTGWTELQKLHASDGMEDDRFGRAVSISGDYIFVGAHKDDFNTGAAYIFMRNGSTWTEQAKLISSDPDTGDFFGVSIGQSGDYTIIGAAIDDSAGSAYVYMRTDSGWVEQVRLTASDGQADDRFGQSVAISGNYAIIGAHADDDLGNGAGSAYVFERFDSVWVEVAKLTASDGTGGDAFGFSLSISGDYIIVGAYGEGGSGRGAAYIFKREGTVWVEQTKLIPSDREPGDEFGVSVEIVPGFAIVGAWLSGSDSTGAAYFFRESGSAWIEAYKLVPSDGATNDEFGIDVALSTTDAIVGATFADGMGSETGAAYCYFDITSDVRETQPFEVARSFALTQNYPNPFNPSTIIRYALEGSTTVELSVHNLLGQKVRSLVNEFQPAGEHQISWDGRDDRGEHVAGGVYLYQLKTGEKIQTKKMMLLK